MSNKYNNPVQIEFFSGHVKNDPKKKNFCYGFKCLTLSFENIIVLCIIFIMSLVLSYSFGVEKGKKIVNIPKKEISEITKIANIDERGAQIVPLAADTVLPEEVIQVKMEPEISDIVENSAVENSLAKEIDNDIFTIQVASFKQEKNAKLEADKLKDIGYDIFVLAKGSYSIVCVGRFAEQKAAVEFSGKLRNRYNDCLVRRL